MPFVIVKELMLQFSVKRQVQNTILKKNDIDDFYGDYVHGAEVSIDGNEFGVWLRVVIELE